jgi:hypothetical protein
MVGWIILTTDNLRWTSKHAAYLGHLLSVEIQASRTVNKNGSNPHWTTPVVAHMLSEFNLLGYLCEARLSLTWNRA